MPEQLVAYIIDDEPLIANVLITLVQGLKFEVQSFASAEEFFEQAKPRGPHLLLVDKNLTGMSGLELVRLHREAGAEFEAILLTGFVDAESAMDAVRLGLYSYVAKPFELEDLVSDVLGAAAQLRARRRGSTPARGSRHGSVALRRLRFPVDSSGAELTWDKLSANKLFETIALAADEAWSGEVTVDAGDEHLGQIVFVKGKIAWATAVDQTENLGTFLWRLGHITPKQLNQVRQDYNKHGGKKKLGLILEEAGMLSRPVLRHCTKLHLEFALSSLFTRAGAEPKLVLTPGEVQEATLFEPEEVLPLPVATGFIKRWSEKFKTSDRWTAISQDNDILSPFLPLEGYLASAVIAYDGSVLVAHFNTSSTKTSIFGVLLATMVEKVTNLGVALDLGEMKSASITCAEGYIAACWVGERRQYLSALLTSREGDPAASMSALEEYTQSIVDWLDGA